MSSILYHHPRWLVLAIAIITALAASAALSIGRQEDPTITNVFATVLTPYPGAEPARVEALVTVKLEARLREISEIAVITSLSRAGMSVIALELGDRVPRGRIGQVWAEVRDALADVATALPAGVVTPSLDTERAAAFTTVSAIVMADGQPPNPALQRRHAEILRDRLRRLPDIQVVRLFGDQEEELSVTVEPELLALLGLTFDDLATAVAGGDAKAPAGRVASEAAVLLVEVAGAIDGIDRLRRVPIAADDNGAVVNLGDLGQVEKTVAQPAAALAFADGKPAVLVAARMAEDRRVDAWSAAARDAMRHFETLLPEGLEHRLVFDQSRYVRDRFASLARNLAIGVALVTVVLVVSLGWRAAAVVAAIIPLATLGSILLMRAFGLPLQQMSVTGLIVALGLLVDAAIVMTDDIARRLAAGQDRAQAVGAATERLSRPLLASTATTIIAFLPMALLPGPTGDFVGSIALAVMIMLGVSLALALTIAPALAGHLLTSGGAIRGRLRERPSPMETAICLALQRPVLAVLASLMLPAMGFLALPTLTPQFFPPVDRDQFLVQLELPAATGIEATAAVARDVAGFVGRAPDVERVDWVVGTSAPAVYYNMKMDRDADPRFAELLVRTASPDATERLLADLQAELDRSFPETRSLVRGLVQGPPLDAPVEVRLSGPDLATLRRLGDEVRAVMVSVPAVTHVRTTLAGGAPKVVFLPDEAAARLAGMTLDDLGAQMAAALVGATGGSLLEGTEELAVRLRLGAEWRGDPARLASLPVVPPGGSAGTDDAVITAIPLSALGTFAVVPAESPIARREGERINTVQAFLVHGVLPQAALNEVLAALDAASFRLPPGYRMALGGEAEARAETLANLVRSADLVVILAVATIVLALNGLRLALIVGVVAGLAFGCSLLALAVFHYPLGIQALVGAIGSIGVSINATLIVLTALQADTRAVTGDAAAIAAVVARQARHIVATTLTTVAGFLPLILGGGGFWPPFAMAVVGGVALSASLAFFFTPPLFAAAVARRSISAPPSAGR